MRRAQPPAPPCSPNRPGGFNPRPTHAPGATGTHVPRRETDDVSILARRMRRAQPYSVARTSSTSMFQSSPDACAGRNRAFSWRMRCYKMFQSSPDACAGRNAGRSTVRLNDLNVSILARRMRRAQPRAAITTSGSIRFQSSPDACAGRNLDNRPISAPPASFNPRPTHAPGATRAGELRGETQEVSILARRMRRAQPRSRRACSSGAAFQSSPDACAGRNRGRGCRRKCRRCFNPRPTHAPGATNITPTRYNAPGCFNPRPTHAPGATQHGQSFASRRNVSILARRMRRAQHFVALDYGWAAACFNPRPTHAPGATSTIGPSAHPQPVSILARRMRRAQPYPPTVKLPPLAFQSSPDACAGRNRNRPQLRACSNRFNPRPTHAPGATRAARCVRPIQPVSILARRMRRAQRHDRLADHIIGDVSILARRMRRAQPRTFDEIMKSVGFQSSPDACAGRNGRVCPAARGREAVSILARRMRRAQPWDFFLDAFPGWVSILARRMRRAQRQYPRRNKQEKRFQSSPDACAGRNHRTQWSRRRSTCFNPRPTHAPGATAGIAAVGRPLAVSILARRMRRAQPSARPTQETHQ